MTNEPVPIWTTLAVSAAAHVLIFGTALSFVHVGDGQLRRDRTVIAVSLVSERGGSGAFGGIARNVKQMQSEPVSSEPTVDRMEEQTSSSATEVGRQGQDGAAQEHQHQGRSNEQASADNTAGGASEGPTGGAAAGHQFGYSSAEWHLLQASLERVKTYPRIARERGIEGTVLVRFRARPSGSIEQVDIVKSSGARILDEASITTVYRAAPVPYVDGWVEVPISYVLK